ncbi:hypothetical protein [Caminibacter sp.]
MKRLLILPLIFFVGCSTRDVFIPKKAVNKPLKSQSHKTLEDYTKRTLTFKQLELNYTKPTSFIDDGVRGVYIYYDKNGKKLGKFEKINKDLAKNGTKLLIIDSKKIVNLPYMAASATKKRNLIAIVFENNAIGIYDLNKNSLVFYKEFSPSIVGKYLKASPVFYQGLLLFPLLNSNIAVYDLRSDNYLRTMDLGDENLISNIIFLKIVNNQLFMATPHELVLFNPNFLINYKGNIKHIIDDGEYLYVFLVGGEVIKFNSKLKKIKTVKLPFADYFAPSICNGKIYTVTKNGYLIEFDKNLNYKVYSGNNFNTDVPLRLVGCKIYNEDRVYEIQ